VGAWLVWSELKKLASPKRLQVENTSGRPKVQLDGYFLHNNISHFGVAVEVVYFFNSAMLRSRVRICLVLMFFTRAQ
jgi:hypothetical protein